MSNAGNSPDAAIPTELLERLKEEDNPFEEYVRPHKPVGSFGQIHIPALNKPVFDRLQAAIHRYRDIDLFGRDDLSEDDLPRSGVAVIFGRRGDGKTHLVHALQTQPIGAFVVAPTHYEPYRPFIEYVLQRLVRELHEVSGSRPGGMVDSLADWFARRVLIQALYGCPDTAWLAQTAADGSAFWKALLGWGTGDLLSSKELLIHDLNENDTAAIFDLFHYRGVQIGTMRQLALRQIELTQGDSTIGGQIRRGLYRHLVRFAFAEDAEKCVMRNELFEFLLDGYTQVEARTQPARETLVEELLHALSRLLLLFRQPLVLAFDALETLLGVPLDEKRCYHFFHGLAEVVDSFRGIPIFLFAESGYWQQITGYMSSYAQQRFQQGVPTRGYGSLAKCEIPRITEDDVRQLIAGRMRRLLQNWYGGSVPEHAQLYPFHESDIDQFLSPGSDNPPLRQIIQSLRDCYHDRVFGHRLSPQLLDGSGNHPFPSGEQETEAVQEMTVLWQREIAAARRQVESDPPSTYLDQLHSGVESWFHYLALSEANIDGRKPQKAEIQTFGNHPTYGQIIRCTWWNGTAKQQTGLGFLAGQGAGMPRDLETKLKLMTSSHEALESLVILWPKAHDGQSSGEQALPPATRTVWQQHVDQQKAQSVKFLIVDPHELIPWLALPAWETALQNQDLKFSETTKSRFIAEQAASLRELVVPVQ